MHGVKDISRMEIRGIYLRIRESEDENRDLPAIGFDHLQVFFGHSGVSKRVCS